MGEARPRILVTGGRYAGVLAALRGLAAGGYEAWSSASAPGSYAARSRSVAGVVEAPEPERDPAGFADALAAAAEEHGLAAILPGTEGALLALARERGRFRAPLGVPDTAIVERALDKEAVARLAGEGPLAPPPTVRVEAGAIPPSLALPAVVKPVQSLLGDGDGFVRGSALRVTTREELEAAVAALPSGRALVQPFQPGRLAAVCGLARDGRVLAASHQVARRTWPLAIGNTAYGAIVPSDPARERAVADVLAGIGWTGIFQLECLILPDGRWTAIDFNPRPYGSLALAISAGCNLAAAWADLVLGREPRIAAPRPGRRYREEVDDARALLALARRGRLPAALAGTIPRPRTAHAVFSLRDPKPLLTTLARLRR